jgi:hypothetical protein
VKLPYKYTVDDAVLQAFSSAKKRHREELLRIFDALASNPFVESDSTQNDTAGRPCRVKRFGPWTVTFWPEHLANEIHIVDVYRLV